MSVNQRQVIGLALEIKRREQLPSWVLPPNPTYDEALSVVWTYAMDQLHTRKGLDSCPECGGDRMEPRWGDDDGF